MRPILSVEGARNHQAARRLAVVSTGLFAAPAFVDVRLALALVLAATLIGCAHERHFVPDRPKARYELLQWPQGTVTVFVTDARAVKTDDSERLVRMVTVIVTDALRAAAGPPTAPRTLTIAITEHKVVFHSRRWYASTRFRVTLQEGPRQVAVWTAAGEDRRLDMLPAYIDADEGSQAGFDRAIADLMAELSTPPP